MITGQFALDMYRRSVFQHVTAGAQEQTGKSYFSLDAHKFLVKTTCSATFTRPLNSAPFF